MTRCVLMAALAVLASACGPIPQPFQGTNKVTADIPMLDVPSAVGIAVVPVSGVPQPFNGQLTKEIAIGLEPFEIPAEAVPANTGLGFSLKGSAINPVRKDGMITADVLWTLTSRQGREAGVYMQAFSVPERDWDQGNATSALRVGREVAAGIAGIIERSTTQAAGGSPAPTPERTTAAPKPVRISVKPADGAPGDGREALQLATLEVLLANGAKRDDVNPEVILMGRVETQPSANGQQFVTIAWRAIAQDGTDLGEVKLTNTIPQGALDGRWGAAAFGIAEAGLAQLQELLALAPRF
jgi:hypothetical protein